MCLIAMSFAEVKLLRITLVITALCQISSLTLAVTTSVPVLYAVNFNAEKTVEVDSTVNFTVQIVSNSSLTSDLIWYRINADLPKDSSIKNSFKDGNNYTTLIINKANYYDDGGTYCLNATNQYGTSTICVDLNIYKDIECYSDNDPVPILSGSENHTTIEGEMVMFKCSFGDNYSSMEYDIYWELKQEDAKHITVKDYVNYTDFQMNTYQDCPPNNYSCCRFTSELSIHTNLSMNNAIVSCVAIINEMTSYNSSDLSVVMRPTIAVPLTNIRAKEGKTVNIDCAAKATTMSDWTLFTWLKNDDTIRSNLNKYNITTEIDPDKSIENFMKSVLTMYDISEEDEGDYTCIVYYDPKVLKKIGINDEFSNRTTATLQVEQGLPLWKTITVLASGIVGIVIIITVVISSYCICKGRRVRGGETSPLLHSPITNYSDCHFIGEPQEETSRPVMIDSEENDDEVDRPPHGSPLFPPSQPQNSSDPPKVDMIILLLLVQTENNKLPPSENDGWLEDVSDLLERIKRYVQLNNDERNVIYGQRLEPEHRSLHLYKMIKERNKINEVSTLLYRIYYANRRSQVTAHGSDNEMTSPSAHPGNYPQEIHHHHHHYNLHIEVTTGAVHQRPEEFVPDIDDFANPLYQHAPDFMHLVDTKTLSPALSKYGLLSPRDMEFLLLPTIIDSEKIWFIYVKLLRRGKEGYENFLLCLKDPYAMQHTGHTDLYHKLSSQQ